ncbi:hypothetical protein D3C87_1523520 [compost metagenome]
MRKATEEAFLAFGGMFHGHENGAAPFATDGEPLEKAHQYEDHGGPVTNLLVGRNEADDDGRDTHHHQRDQQHGFSPNLVTKVAEDNASKGPGEEADGVGRERGEGPADRIEAGKEDLVEN